MFLKKTACFVFVFIFLMNFSSVVKATDDQNVIKANWLKEQVKKLAINKNANYAIYFLPISGNGEKIVLNNKKMLISSLANIPILLELYNQKVQGKIILDDKVVLKKETMRKDGYLYDNVNEKNTYSYKELAKIMISRNDFNAKNTLINKLTMAAIESMVQKQEMKETVIKQDGESYSSVKDIAGILEKMYWLNCIDPDCDQEMLEMLDSQRKNDLLPALLPRNIRIAHVADEVKNDMHDCGLVYGESSDYILCIMTEKIADMKVVADDIAKISQMIYDKSQELNNNK